MGWLSEMGRVVAIEPDAVWVEADRSAACGKCAARAGCGQGALSAMLQSGKGRVRAVSSDDLKAEHCALGEEVVIQVPESTLLSGTLMIYGFPLLVATVAAVAASSAGDLASVAAFGAGLLVGFATLRWMSKHSGGSLPGIAEPRLAARRGPAVGEVLAKI
jgi:sigma-E factor negative regulatory protein RseC